MIDQFSRSSPVKRQQQFVLLKSIIIPDGGFTVGDLVEVYDLRKKLRCIVKITEFYNTILGNISERLWRGEDNKDAEEFKRAHLYCWSAYNVTDDFKISRF